jgi:cytochrome c-type protein NapC
MKKIFFLICCGIILGLVLSLTAAEMIEQTSGREFCSSCHSMKGVARSNTGDVHGGMNKLGFIAKCADCHLPHDNVFHYVTAKAYTGAKDVLGEIFWADSFDWVGNLQHKEKFTYTSGCVKCHDLTVIRYEIPKAFLAHKDFLSGKEPSCVKCHEHVGHKNIKDFLVQ